MSIQLTDSLKNLLKETAKELKGAAKRKFIAQTVAALEHGGQSLAQQELGWNRVTIKAMQEIENKIVRLTNFSEDNLPNLGKWFTVRTCRQLLKVESAMWLFVTTIGVEPTNIS